jgi:hypothetical protein
MGNKLAQKDQIIVALKLAWISPLTAQDICGTMRFGSRIHEIRKEFDGDPDWELDWKWCICNGARFKAFKLVSRNKQ